jgi:hypothetical protein
MYYNIKHCLEKPITNYEKKPIKFRKPNKIQFVGPIM